MEELIGLLIGGFLGWLLKENDQLEKEKQQTTSNFGGGG